MSNKQQGVDLAADFLMERIDRFEAFLVERGKPRGMALALIMAMYSAARQQECHARLGLIPRPEPERLVAEFVGEALSPAMSSKLAIAPLYCLFQAWCLRRGLVDSHIPSRPTFTMVLAGHGQLVIGGGTHFIAGLALRQAGGGGQ